MRAVLSLFVLGLLVAAVTLSAHAEDSSRIEWRTDLARARAEARATGKPLLVVFRCPP